MKNLSISRDPTFCLTMRGLGRIFAGHSKYHNSVYHSLNASMRKAQTRVLTAKKKEPNNKWIYSLDHLKGTQRTISDLIAYRLWHLLPKYRRFNAFSLCALLELPFSSAKNLLKDGRKSAPVRRVITI
jgi:hypothetical protein